MRQHRTYPRIQIDGFEGPAPEPVYAAVVGHGGDAFRRAASFEDRVTAAIDQIDRRQTGRIILQHLQHVGHTNGIMIRPASVRNNEVGTWPNRPADAFAPRQPVPRSAAHGTGRGTDVTISYEDSRSECQFTGTPDAVLLHELIHAIRAITGTQHYIPMRSYDRFEEFVAVTVTNVYFSETRQPLRDGHGCDRMNPDVAHFRQIYGPALNRIDRDVANAPLFQSLRALPPSVAPWNPFVPFFHIDLMDGEAEVGDLAMRQYRSALPDAIRATSLEHGIQSILQRLGSHGRIGRLRILAHGNQGLQGVAHSQYPFRHGSLIIELVDGHIRGEQSLRRLTGRLGPGSWVELHGCLVASDGGALILALARLWNVPVKASLDLQRAGGGLDGRVLVAWPDGRIEQRSSDRMR